MKTQPKLPRQYPIQKLELIHQMTHVSEQIASWSMISGKTTPNNTTVRKEHVSNLKEIYSILKEELKSLK